MEAKETRTRTVRLPIELDNRIVELAHKRFCSVNAWVVRTLERKAHPPVNTTRG